MIPAELAAIRSGMAETFDGMDRQFAALAARGAIPAPSQFLARLYGLKVPLPLKLDPDEAGIILDADGDEVAIVDANWFRKAEEAAAIATLIVQAVNAAAGVRT